MSIELINGDCIEELKNLSDNSVDSIETTKNTHEQLARYPTWYKNNH